MKEARIQNMEIRKRIAADYEAGTLTWTALYLARKKYDEKYREAANV